MKLKILALGVIIALGIIGFYFLAGPRWQGSQGNLSWELLTEAEPLATHALPFSRIWFFDELNGLSLSPITIQKSNDGGKTWVSVRNWDHKGFSSLVFTGTQNGWIVGSAKEKPLVLKTESRGLNWQDWEIVSFDKKSQTEMEKTFTHFNDICFDPNGRVWIVGDGGVIEAVFDGPTLRASSIFSTKEALYDVSCATSGEVWAVGVESAVLHYKDGWTRLPVDKSYLFEKVILSGNEVWILGGIRPPVEIYPPPGILLRSRNNGLTWEDKTPNSAPLLKDLVLRDGRGWLVGAEGAIYHSTDNGESWIKLKAPTQNDLQEIFFLDSRNVWIAGDKATVLRLERSEIVIGPALSVIGLSYKEEDGRLKIGLIS